jgi:predicted TIM-barrel fold metal-dependent hydrolase
MIVDVCVHWYPHFFTDKAFLRECIRLIPRAWGDYVEQRTDPVTGASVLVVSKPKGYVNLTSSPKCFDSSDRLRAMDKVGVDMSVLRWPIWPERVSLDISRKVNDSMAKTVREHPDRFLGLAIVPPWGDEDCLEELDRCVNDLGCVGVQVAAHYGNLYLDAEEFRPFFKRINELNVPVIVHHTDMPVDYNSIYEYTNLRRMYGRCMDQMICASRIMFSGMLDEMPNLKFIHTMMAGGLFTYIDLISPPKSTVEGDLERWDPGASAKIEGYLKRNIYCDMTHAPTWAKPVLECAIKIQGADHILFGSSYPLRSEWLYKGVDYVRSLNIGEEEKSLILGENAARLFNIKENQGCSRSCGIPTI